MTDSCDGCKPLEGQICMLSLNSAHWVDDVVMMMMIIMKMIKKYSSGWWLHIPRELLYSCSPLVQMGFQEKLTTDKTRLKNAGIHGLDPFKIYFSFVFFFFNFLCNEKWHMGCSWSKVYEILIWSGNGFTNLRAWIKAMVNCNKTGTYRPELWEDFLWKNWCRDEEKFASLSPQLNLMLK